MNALIPVKEKWLWIGLAILRVLFVAQPGYIHPDEFFQSSEIAAHSIFHFDTFVPWEFVTGCRSILPPFLISGFSFFIMKLLDSHVFVDNWLALRPELLLIGPRLILVVASFLCDALLLRIAAKIGVASPHLVTCIVASAWPSLVMGTRTFSNTLESYLLVVALGVVLLDWTSSNIWRGIVFGGITALGFWTRFTFLFFAFPFGTYLLYRSMTIRASWSLGAGLRCILAVMFGFGIGAFALISIDSYYYGRFIVTPLNSLVYNMNTENLREHGLHPHYLHLLVNMPLMYGPLFLLSAFSFCRWTTSIIDSTFKYPKTKKTSRKSKRLLIARLFSIRFMLGGSIVLPLLFLSCAPHQEPRFLLPMLPAMALLCASQLVGKGTPLIMGWLAWNVAATLFFGILHQGGLIPSLQYLCRYIHQHSETGGNVIFFHTHMPPRHLLQLPESNKTWHVHDLGGGPLSALYRLLDEHSRSSPDLVVVPSSVSLGIRAAQFQQLQSFAPHVSMEDPPGSLGQATLLVYTYTPI